MLRLINAVGTVQSNYVPVLQHSVCYCGESCKAASAQTSVDIYCDQVFTCHFILLPNDKTILCGHTYRYLKISLLCLRSGLVSRLCEQTFCEQTFILRRVLWAEDAAGSHVMSMYIS